MNKNVENYKKAVDQIHVDSNLKEKVLEEAKRKSEKKNPIYYFRYVTAIAAIAIVAVVGIGFLTQPKEEVFNPKSNGKQQKPAETLAKVDIRRFESMEELREVLEETTTVSGTRYYGDVTLAEDAKSSATDSAVAESATTGATNSEYSRTNNQVESVDEADIVKTDGNHIYYSQNGRIYIADKNLNLKATIQEKGFHPNQIFVNGDQLVVFGSKQDNSVMTYRNYYIEVPG